MTRKKSSSTKLNIDLDTQLGQKKFEYQIKKNSLGTKMNIEAKLRYQIRKKKKLRYQIKHENQTQIPNSILPLEYHD